MTFLTQDTLKVIFLLSVLTAGCAQSQPNCSTRRCLSKMLIDKNSLSQPQGENCTIEIRVPTLEYTTLKVDTKDLRLISRLQASIEWQDPELAWDTSVFNFEEVVLPVNKIWTPELRVTNAITSAMEHNYADLLVYSNGTLKHSVIINAEVNCEVNLFNYPFASDTCPVAIQTWDTYGCGTVLTLGELNLVDSSHGDWRTTDATFQKRSDNRNYVEVGLELKYTNSFITLMLPSYLIIIVDIVSFALPLGGGERNSFKVTLVLSFILFINILDDKLPGDGECSPIIRIHFCVCLILLVLSMLVSMITTLICQEGLLVFCRRSKKPIPENRKENEHEETKTDISVIQLDALEENSHILKKLAKFLEALDTKEAEREQNHNFANFLDKIFFWIYFIGGLAYLIIMSLFIALFPCSVNHFDFWY